MAIGFRSPLFLLGIGGAAVAGAEVRQPGGFIPRQIVYLDEDGNPVDIEKVKEVVEEAVEAALETAKPRKAASVRKSADRALAALTAAQAATDQDIKRLRAALKQSEAALAALDRAIDAQRDEEDALALILAA